MQVLMYSPYSKTSLNTRSTPPQRGVVLLSISSCLEFNYLNQFNTRTLFIINNFHLSIFIRDWILVVFVTSKQHIFSFIFNKAIAKCFVNLADINLLLRSMSIVWLILTDDVLSRYITKSWFRKRYLFYCQMACLCS